MGIAHARAERPLTETDDVIVDLDSATVVGTIVHAVLEQVDFRDPTVWPELLVKVASHNQQAPEEEVFQQAQAMLARFFESDLLAVLAKAKTIHREIDFVLPWPTLGNPTSKDMAVPPRFVPMIAGIIDLLIETDAGWRILDFKTGEFPLAAKDEGLLAPYEMQLGLYAHAVEQWFGAAPVELSLITFKPKIRRITLPWSKARWTQIQARVNRAMETLRLG